MKPLKMKKLISTAMSVTVAAACAAMPVSASESSVSPNDIVFGYQQEDFEGYREGAVTCSSSDDLFGGKLNASYNNGTTQYSIVKEGNNRYLKVLPEQGVSNIYVNMPNKDNELNNEMDYFVIKYDLKNGDDESSEITYLQQQRIVRNDAESMQDIQGATIFRKYIKKYDWNEYMFIGDKAGKKLIMVLNGEYVGELDSDDVSTTGNFYAMELFDFYSNTSKNRVMYIDNMEIYGVIKDEHISEVELNADGNVVYASFDCPVKGFSADNITVEGGASVENVEFSDGVYAITLGNVGAAVKVSVNATDIYDCTVSGSVNIEAPAVPDKTEYYGYQSQDFEGYTAGTAFITESGSLDGQFSGTYSSNVTNNIEQSDTGKYLAIRRSGNNDPYPSLNFNNNGSIINNSGFDYYVLSYCMKNGDSVSNAYAYVHQKAYSLRNDGEYLQNISPSDTTLYNGNTAIKVGDWNRYMYIGSKADGKMYYALNGRIVGEMFNCDFISDYNRPFVNELWTYYSGNPTDAVMYVDDYELYALKNGEISDSCAMAQDDEDKTVVYALFENPIMYNAFTADNVVVEGAQLESVDYVTDKWVIKVNAVPNSNYTVKVTGVVDIYGVTVPDAVTEFSTGAAAPVKTYLSTDVRFSGYEDFENYSGTGIIASLSDDTVNIVNNASGVRLADTWSNYTGGAGGVKTALVKEADGNTVYKVYLDSAPASGEFLGIVQPQPDHDWTDETDGRIFVYKAKFRSGGNGEEPVYLQYFGLDEAKLQLYYDSGTVISPQGTVENAIKKGEWNSITYIIDKTGSTPKVSAFINNDVVLDAKEVSQTAIKNSDPRFEAGYPKNNVSYQSIYYDDIEIYTVEGVQGAFGVGIDDENVTPGGRLTVHFDDPVVLFDTADIQCDAAVKEVSRVDALTWEISFDGELVPGETYNINISNTKDIYGNTVIPAALSFVCVEGGNATIVNADTSGITVDNTGAGFNAELYLASYAADGRVISVVCLNTKVIAGSATYDIPGLNNDGAEYIKAYVWQGMRPCAAAYQK